MLSTDNKILLLLTPDISRNSRWRSKGDHGDSKSSQIANVLVVKTQNTLWLYPTYHFPFATSV